jgi:hypothetical protein
MITPTSKGSCLICSMSVLISKGLWLRAVRRSTYPLSFVSEPQADNRLLKTSAEVDVWIDGSGRVLDHMRAHGEPSELCPLCSSCILQQAPFWTNSLGVQPSHLARYRARSPEAGTAARGSTSVS